MKKILEAHKNNSVLVATLACLILAGSISAFAVPAGQVARVLTNPTVTATCCVSLGITVTAARIVLCCWAHYDSR